MLEREAERFAPAAAEQRIRATGGAISGGTARSTLAGMTAFVQRHATGWQPSCRCPDPGPPVPCRVLDCFMGTGTTLLVADRLGRDGIGIDLSPEYVAMAEARLRGDGPMFADVDVGGGEAAG